MRVDGAVVFMTAIPERTPREWATQVAQLEQQVQILQAKVEWYESRPVKPLITHGPYASTTGLSYGLAGGGERGMIG